MQDIATENVYNTLTVLLQFWKYNLCMNKRLPAGISELQRESGYYHCTMIPRCVTENEHQSSFEDCFKAVWEALYTYLLCVPYLLTLPCTLSCA